MAKKEPVSVNWQSLFSIIPLVQIWAFYRVERLRRYLLYMISIGVVYLLIGEALFGFDAFIDEDLGTNGYYFEAVFSAIEIGLSVGLIRMWSKKWNEQFSKTSVEQ